VAGCLIPLVVGGKVSRKLSKLAKVSCGDPWPWVGKCKHLVVTFSKGGHEHVSHLLSGHEHVSHLLWRLSCPHGKALVPVRILDEPPWKITIAEVVFRGWDHHFRQSRMYKDAEMPLWWANWRYDTIRANWFPSVSFFSTKSWLLALLIENTSEHGWLLRM
jgi:hypothetical protein